MRRTIFTTAAMIACVSAGALTQATLSSDASALRQEVESLNRQMEAAFGRGDLKGVAAFYADDAVIRSPHQVAAQGRAAIDRYFTSVASPKRWKLDVYGVTPGGGNVVYQTGMSTLVHGSPERSSKFQFVLVWERQRDGKLRIALDYYHVPEPRGG